MLLRRGISALTVGATYIGTVVGAGFASGQEIRQFFGGYGRLGLAGLVLATVLFLVFGFLVLDLGKKVGAGGHLEVVRAVCGPYLAGPVDGIITFFLFGAVSVMAAGSGALASEQWGLPPLAGAATMMGAAVLTVLMGLGAVVKAVSVVVPALLLSVAGIGAAVWFLDGPPSWPPANSLPPIGPWPLAALLYVSYNLTLAIAVLAPLGARCPGRRVLVGGALIGAGGLGLGALAVHVAVMASWPWTSQYEVPMVHVARQFGYWPGRVYAVVLLAEVYTTAVASLYGLAVRFGSMLPGSFRRMVLIGGAGALAASRLGFASLIRLVYPLMGYAGLVFLAALTYRLLHRR